MPQIEDTTTAVVAEAAPVAAKAKKAPAKKAAKPAKAAKAVKKAATNGAAPKAKKDGLRGPQVRILTCLSKAKGPLTRNQISEKAPVDVATCVEYIGSTDKDRREANDTKHFPSLISLGLVKYDTHEVDGRDTIAYTITPKGRTQLEKEQKAAK